MRSQKSLQFVRVAAALTMITATASLPVLAGEGAVADKLVVTGSHGGMYPETVNSAVNPADALINHLHEAEVQLNSGSVARARSILKSSLEFSRKLQFMQAETERALQHINRSHETNGNGVGVLPVNWVGVYSSLDEIKDYAPEVAEQARASLKQDHEHATTADIQRTAETLKKIAAGVPSSLLPGHAIDRQILLALELLGENQPDVATAKSVVTGALNRVIAVDQTTTSQAKYRMNDCV